MFFYSLFLINTVRYGKLVHSSAGIWQPKIDRNQPLWMIPEKVRINDPQRYMAFINFIDANPPHRVPPGSDFMERFYPCAHATFYLESFLGDLTVAKVTLPLVKHNLVC